MSDLRSNGLGGEKDAPLFFLLPYPTSFTHKTNKQTYKLTDKQASKQASKQTKETSTE